MNNKLKLHGNNQKKVILFVVVCLVLLLVSMLLSLAFGSRNIPFSDVFKALFSGKTETFEEQIIQKRIYRTIFCVLAGIALGVSGALMQAITRNPIADPSILGVNTGASLFVVVGISFFGISTANHYIWLALAGAFITAIFVYFVGSIGRNGATPIKLALAGAATAAALNSLISALLIPRENVMDQFRFWQVGSVGRANLDSIKLFLPFLIVGLIISIASSSALNAMALGDDVAVGLGVRTGRTRLLAALAGIMLCGATTAIAGPIGFVGLISPHVVRLIVGADQKQVISLSALVGAIILTASDVVGRVIASPGELEVGVVTAFIGAPFLIFFAMKSKVRSL